MRDPSGYFGKQVPDWKGTGAAPDFSPEALGVTFQLLNVLLLLAPIAVLCCFSRDPATAKSYLAAVALADYGHVYATYRAVGDDIFFHPTRWNDMVWGGVAGSLVLNVIRWLTLFGAFGPIVSVRGAADAERKRQ